MPPLRARGFGHTGWKQQHAQELATKVLEMPHHDTLPSRIQARMDDIFLGCSGPAGINASKFLAHLSRLYISLAVSTSPPQPTSDAANTWLPHAHFATSLLHAYLALSWRPLKDSMSSSGVDDLAAPSAWGLPTEVYAAAVEALGMHHLLLELLAMIPSASMSGEPAGAQLTGDSSLQHLVLLANLLQARPSLSIGLMAVLMPQADFSGSACAAEEPPPAQLEQGPATLMIVLMSALRSWRRAASTPSPGAAAQRLHCLEALCLFIIWCLSGCASDPAHSVLLPGPVLAALGLPPQQSEAQPIPVAVILADAVGSLDALLCDWQDELCKEDGVAGLLVLLERMAGHLGIYSVPSPQPQQHVWPCGPLDTTALIRMRCRLMLFKAAAAQGPPVSGPMSRRPVTTLVNSPLLLAALLDCGISLLSPLDPVLASICSSPCNTSSLSPAGTAPELTPSLWTFLPGMRGHDGSVSARAIRDLAAGAVGCCMHAGISTACLAAWSLPLVSGSIGAAWAQRVAGIAVAMLTPGISSSLPGLQHPAAQSARGADPYCGLSCTLASLDQVAVVSPGSDARALGVTFAPELPRLLMHMLAGSAAGVKRSGQQQALLQTVAGSPVLPRLVSDWSRDLALQASVKHLLVQASNRTVSQQGLERTGGVIVSHQLAQDLPAISASELLPLAIVSPRLVLSRLVADAVHHPSQLALALDVISAFSPVFVCHDRSIAAASDQPHPDTMLAATLSELLMPKHSSEDTSASPGDPPLLLHHSTADRAALLNLCGGLSERRILGREAQLRQVAAPLLQARLDGHIGQPQAHTALVLAADCLHSPGGGALLRSPADDSSSSCRFEAGPFLLLLAQLRALWSQQPHFDAVCLELVCNLLELAVVTIREEGVAEWASPDRLSAQEAADSGHAATPMGSALVQRAKQMLLQLEPLTHIGSSLPLMLLLPALEAPLSLLFALHRQLCSSITDALLPASIWRRCKAGPESFASFFQWFASCDYHSSLMVGLLMQRRSETGSGSGSDEDPGEDSPHDILRGTARTVSGSIHRGLMRVRASSGGGRLSDHIAAALAGLLPTASTQQATRMLGEGLPAVVSALAMQEACEWQSTSAHQSQSQGTGQTSCHAPEGARLTVLAAFPDGLTPFCLHLLFEAVKRAVVCVPEVRDLERYGGPGSGCSQSIADRCFTHASMQVQRLFDCAAVFPSTSTAVHVGGSYAEAAARKWALSLVALCELVSCHVTLASQFDCGTLQVLALSLIRTLCAPSIVKPAEASILVPCLGITYKAVLAAVIEAISPLQGSCPEAIEQLQLVASKTVQGHVEESLELVEAEVAALVDMFAGV